MAGNQKQYLTGWPGSAAARVFALAVVALAVFLSVSPQLSLPDAAPDRTDLIIHVIMHIGVAGSLHLGWPSRPGWVVLVVTVLAILLEGAQIAVPGRLFALSDLIANLLGVFLGLMIARHFCRKTCVKSV